MDRWMYESILLHEFIKLISFFSVYLCVKWEGIIVITSKRVVRTNELPCITWLQEYSTCDQHTQKKDKADTF